MGWQGDPSAVPPTRAAATRQTRSRRGECHRAQLAPLYSQKAPPVVKGGWREARAGLNLHLTADTCLVPLGALLPPLLLDTLGWLLLQFALGRVCFVRHGSDLVSGCDIAYRAAGAGEPRTPVHIYCPLRASPGRTGQALAHSAPA